MYWRISTCRPNLRVKSCLGSNEYEYKCDCTSQAAPGYVLSRQVPPTLPAFSRMTNESMPAFFSWIAMHRPPKPEPTTATVVAARYKVPGEFMCALDDIRFSACADSGARRSDANLQISEEGREGKRWVSTR